MLEDDELRTFLRTGHPEDLADYRRTLERNLETTMFADLGSIETATRRIAARIEADALERHETLGSSVLTDRALERLSRELAAWFDHASPDTAVHPSVRRILLLRRMAGRMKAIDEGTWTAADVGLMNTAELRAFHDAETSLPFREDSPPDVLNGVPAELRSEAAELLAAGWDPEAPEGEDPETRSHLHATAERIGWRRILEDHARSLAENRIRLEAIGAAEGAGRPRNDRTIAAIAEAVSHLERNDGLGTYEQAWRAEGGEIRIDPRDARGYLRGWYLRQFHELSDGLLREILCSHPSTTALFDAIGSDDAALKDELRRARSGLAIAAELLLHEEKASAARTILAKAGDRGFSAADFEAIGAVAAAAVLEDVAAALGGTPAAPTAASEKSDGHPDEGVAAAFARVFD